MSGEPRSIQPDVQGEADLSSPIDAHGLQGSISQSPPDSSLPDSHSRTSRLDVPIPTDWNAPIGPNATKFAGEAGSSVRGDSMKLSYKRWSCVPASDRVPIVDGLKAKFNCTGLPRVVDAVVNRKLATSRRQHKYRLHKAWQKLVELHGEAHARANPPRSCTPEQWTDLIDSVWTTETFQVISSKYKSNRRNLLVNHSSGSKSFPIRAHEEMKGGEGEFNFTDFYKDTHYNRKNNKWSTPTCQTIHSRMVNDNMESLYSQPDLPPRTPEEISARYLGTRSGIVKGIGKRPTLGSSRDEEVTKLERRLEEQDKIIARHQEQMETVMEFMRKIGYSGQPPPPDDGAAGCGLAS